ncbi:hypothetical protein J3A83DRAFT_4185784 [Scleroderma citrinum]
MTDLKSAQVDMLLLKSLLGEDIIDIKFCLFSSRSKRGEKVFRPRALHANIRLLCENSPYFASLLREKTRPLDHAMFEFRGHNHPQMISDSEYGYNDDSDLEDEDTENKESVAKLQTAADAKDKICALDKVASDTSKDIVKNAPEVRHIFIRDTAYRTWKALLFYFYTGRIYFAVLKSTCPRFPESASSIQSTPTCSAKSMYRLACKMDLKELQMKALDFICGTMTNLNVVIELGSPLLASHRPIFDAVLDILFRHIDSPPVKSALPTLFKRIADGQLRHGADILNAIYEKVLAKHYATSNPVPPSLPITDSNATFSFNVKPSAIPSSKPSIISFKFSDNFGKTSSGSRLE